jgi:hypothetical protein
VTCGIWPSFSTEPVSEMRSLTFLSEDLKDLSLGRCSAPSNSPSEAMLTGVDSNFVYLMSVDWLATHCQASFSRIQVSVKRPWREKGFPFSSPLSR